MNRPSREELAAALVAVDERAPDGMDASILADEVRALRAENPDMTTHAIADAITREVIASMREENARLREEQKHWHDQLVSAQSECRELREECSTYRNQLVIWQDETRLAEDNLGKEQAETARMQESIDLYRATIERVEALCERAIPKARDCSCFERVREVLRGGE